MSWFWLNIPLAAIIFSATAGIPLWMVIKYPDGAAGRRGRRAQGALITVPVSDRPQRTTRHPGPYRARLPVGVPRSVRVTMGGDGTATEECP
ncbi:MAG: hypothetical protein ABJB47_06040 [Actinomycetota bacterium]